MAARSCLFLTTLPILLPLFVHAMPAPYSSSPVHRRQLDPMAATPMTVIVAETATFYTTVTSTLISTSPLAVPAPPPSSNPNAPSTDHLDVPFLIVPGGSPPLTRTLSSTSQVVATGTSDPNVPSSFSSPPDLTTTSSTGAPSSTADATPLVMAYYPAWVVNDYPPENIDFNRFDWIDFAFAVPNQDFSISWDGSDDAPDTLRRLVTRAHASGKRVKLSVGGWTGSKFFSSAVATPQSRATLANNIFALYQQFGLDGIDIDWEYPGQDGNTGNIVNPDDSANFLEFLRILRNILPPNATITAATQTVPFADTEGNPLPNVSAFAQVLDWVLLMNYDTWGSSSKPGPNAPLSDACHNSTQHNANALSALQIWTDAGFPPRQLVLGMPSYGYISRSSATMLQTRAGTRFSSLAGPSRPPSSSGSSATGRRLGRRRSLVTRGAGAWGWHWERGWDLEHTLKRRRKIRNKQRAQAHATGERARARAWSRAVGWVESLADLLPGGAVRVKNEDGGTNDGQVQFRDLVRQGVLQGYEDAGSGSAQAQAQAGSMAFSVELASPGADGDTDADMDDGSTNDSTSSSTNTYSSTNANANANTSTPAYTGSFSGQGPAALRAAIEERDHTGSFSGQGPAALRAAIEERDPRALFAGAGGFVRMWDACSSTPYLRSAGAGQVVTYDDPVSLEMKAEMVRGAGMRGVNLFDVHGDTDGWDLTDGLRRGLGLV